MAASSDIAQQDAARFERLKTDRSNFETTWQQQRRVFFPSSLDFIADNDTQGQRDRRLAVDGFGIITVEELADYIVASMASPAQKSFGIRLADGYDQPDPMEAQWLIQVEKIVHGAFHDPFSQFADAFKAAARECSGYDNSAMYVGDRPGKLPLFMHVPLAQSTWSLDGDGELDTFDWRKKYTARQARLKFGDACPPALAEMARNPRTEGETLDFQHCMLRNIDRVEGSPEFRHRPWVTRWICVDEPEVLSTAYLDEACYFTFSQPRMGENIYGTGPASNALEDTNMSQRVRVSGVRGLEKAVDPLTLLPDDGIMSAPTFESRGVMIVRRELLRDGNAPVVQLPPQGKPELALQFGEQLHLAIARHFKTDKLSLPREPRMPVQHIIGLQAEQMKALAPILLCYVKPLAMMVGRVYAILDRAGRLPDAPMQLQQKRVRIAYESPAIRQLALAEAQASIQWIEILGAAARIDQDVLALPKMIDVVRAVGVALGVPATLMNTPDDVKAANAARQEVLEQQHQTEQGKDVSTIAKNAAPFIEAVGSAANTQEAA